METAPQALEPLWRDSTLGKLIGRLIETKNLTRGSGGDEGDVRGREVQQVKALRGVIGELVEWDRDVLGMEGRDCEGVVRIVVTPPEEGE